MDSQTIGAVVVVPVSGLIVTSLNRQISSSTCCGLNVARRTRRFGANVDGLRADVAGVRALLLVPTGSPATGRRGG